MLKLIMVDCKVEDKSFINFYIQLENGARIRIKNVFKDDFGKLRLIAEKVNE